MNNIEFTKFKYPWFHETLKQLKYGLGSCNPETLKSSVLYLIRESTGTISQCLRKKYEKKAKKLCRVLKILLTHIQLRSSHLLEAMVKPCYEDVAALLLSSIMDLKLMRMSVREDSMEDLNEIFEDFLLFLGSTSEKLWDIFLQSSVVQKTTPLSAPLFRAAFKVSRKKIKDPATYLKYLLFVRLWKINDKENADEIIKGAVVVKTPKNFYKWFSALSVGHFEFTKSYRERDYVRAVIKKKVPKQIVLKLYKLLAEAIMECNDDSFENGENLVNVQNSLFFIDTKRTEAEVNNTEEDKVPVEKDKYFINLRKELDEFSSMMTSMGKKYKSTPYIEDASADNSESMLQSGEEVSLNSRKRKREPAHINDEPIEAIDFNENEALNQAKSDEPQPLDFLELENESDIQASEEDNEEIVDDALLHRTTNIDPMKEIENEADKQTDESSSENAEKGDNKVSHGTCSNKIAKVVHPKMLKNVTKKSEPQNQILNSSQHISQLTGNEITTCIDKRFKKRRRVESCLNEAVANDHAETTEKTGHQQDGKKVKVKRARKNKKISLRLKNRNDNCDKTSPTESVSNSETVTANELMKPRKDKSRKVDKKVKSDEFSAFPENVKKKKKRSIKKAAFDQFELAKEINHLSNEQDEHVVNTELKRKKKRSRVEELPKNQLRTEISPVERRTKKHKISGDKSIEYANEKKSNLKRKETINSPKQYEIDGEESVSSCDASMDTSLVRSTSLFSVSVSSTDTKDGNDLSTSNVKESRQRNSGSFTVTPLKTSPMSADGRKVPSSKSSTRKEIKKKSNKKRLKDVGKNVDKKMALNKSYDATTESERKLLSRDTSTAKESSLTFLDTLSTDSAEQAKYGENDLPSQSDDVLTSTELKGVSEANVQQNESNENSSDVSHISENEVDYTERTHSKTILPNQHETQLNDSTMNKDDLTINSKCDVLEKPLQASKKSEVSVADINLPRVGLVFDELESEPSHITSEEETVPICDTGYVSDEKEISCFAISDSESNQDAFIHETATEEFIPRKVSESTSASECLPGENSGNSIDFVSLQIPMFPKESTEEGLKKLEFMAEWIQEMCAPKLDVADSSIQEFSKLKDSDLNEDDVINNRSSSVTSIVGKVVDKQDFSPSPTENSIQESDSSELQVIKPTYNYSKKVSTPYLTQKGESPLKPNFVQKDSDDGILKVSSSSECDSPPIKSHLGDESDELLSISGDSDFLSEPENQNVRSKSTLRKSSIASSNSNSLSKSTFRKSLVAASNTDDASSPVKINKFSDADNKMTTQKHRKLEEEDFNLSNTLMSSPKILNAVESETTENSTQKVGAKAIVSEASILDKGKLGRLQPSVDSPARNLRSRNKVPCQSTVVEEISVNLRTEASDNKQRLNETENNKVMQVGQKDSFTSVSENNDDEDKTSMNKDAIENLRLNLSTCSDSETENTAVKVTSKHITGIIQLQEENIVQGDSSNIVTKNNESFSLNLSTCSDSETEATTVRIDSGNLSGITRLQDDINKGIIDDPHTAVSEANRIDVSDNDEENPVNRIDSKNVLEISRQSPKGKSADSEIKLKNRTPDSKVDTNDNLKEKVEKKLSQNVRTYLLRQTPRKGSATTSAEDPVNKISNLTKEEKLDQASKRYSLRTSPQKPTALSPTKADDICNYRVLRSNRKIKVSNSKDETPKSPSAKVKKDLLGCLDEENLDKNKSEIISEDNKQKNKVNQTENGDISSTMTSTTTVETLSPKKGESKSPRCSPRKNINSVEVKSDSFTKLNQSESSKLETSLNVVESVSSLPTCSPMRTRQSVKENKNNEDSKSPSAKPFGYNSNLDSASPCAKLHSKSLNLMEESLTASSLVMNENEALNELNQTAVISPIKCSSVLKSNSESPKKYNTKQAVEVLNTVGDSVTDTVSQPDYISLSDYLKITSSLSPNKVMQSEKSTITKAVESNRESDIVEKQNFSLIDICSSSQVTDALSSDENSELSEPAFNNPTPMNISLPCSDLLSENMKPKLLDREKSKAFKPEEEPAVVETTYQEKNITEEAKLVNKKVTSESDKSPCKNLSSSKKSSEVRANGVTGQSKQHSQKKMDNNVPRFEFDENSLESSEGQMISPETQLKSVRMKLFEDEEVKTPTKGTLQAKFSPTICSDAMETVHITPESNLENSNQSKKESPNKSSTHLFENRSDLVFNSDKKENRADFPGRKNLFRSAPLCLSRTKSSDKKSKLTRKKHIHRKSAVENKIFPSVQSQEKVSDSSMEAVHGSVINRDSISQDESDSDAKVNKSPKFLRIKKFNYRRRLPLSASSDSSLSDSDSRKVESVNKLPLQETSNSALASSSAKMNSIKTSPKPRFSLDLFDSNVSVSAGSTGDQLIGEGLQCKTICSDIDSTSSDSCEDLNVNCNKMKSEKRYRRIGHPEMTQSNSFLLRTDGSLDKTPSKMKDKEKLGSPSHEMRSSKESESLLNVKKGKGKTPHQKVSKKCIVEQTVADDETDTEAYPTSEENEKTRNNQRRSKLGEQINTKPSTLSVESDEFSSSSTLAYSSERKGHSNQAQMQSNSSSVNNKQSDLLHKNQDVPKISEEKIISPPVLKEYYPTIKRMQVIVKPLNQGEIRLNSANYSPPIAKRSRPTSSETRLSDTKEAAVQTVLKSSHIAMLTPSIQTRLDKERRASKSVKLARSAKSTTRGRPSASNIKKRVPDVGSSPNLKSSTRSGTNTNGPKVNPNSGIGSPRNPKTNADISSSGYNLRSRVVNA